MLDCMKLEVKVSKSWKVMSLSNYWRYTYWPIQPQNTWIQVRIGQTNDAYHPRGQHCTCYSHILRKSCPVHASAKSELEITPAVCLCIDLTNCVFVIVSPLEKYRLEPPFNWKYIRQLTWSCTGIMCKATEMPKQTFVKMEIQTENWGR